MEAKEKHLLIYTTTDGRAPLEEWFLRLGDRTTKARILNRIDRLRLGNFGDCNSIGEGIHELRIHFGPGFRVYFGLAGEEIILLLCGGDKDSQPKDIASAKKYWQEYKSHGNKEL